jgi:hypothetical protein
VRRNALICCWLLYEAASVSSTVRSGLNPSFLRLPPYRPDHGACQELVHDVVNASVPCSAAPCALGTPQVCDATRRQHLHLCLLPHSL